MGSRNIKEGEDVPLRKGGQLRRLLIYVKHGMGAAFIHLQSFLFLVCLMLGGSISAICIWPPSQRLVIYYPLCLLEEESACVVFGKLYMLRVLSEEVNGKPFMRTVYLGNPGKGYYKSEST